MSRQRHDHLSKDVLQLWLQPLGDVTLDARLAGEARRGDVVFVERRRNPSVRKRLGLLGELAHGTLLFELFRNPPTLAELESCVVKRIELHAHALRKARRLGKATESVARAGMCVVVPELSADKKRACGVDPGAVGGVYPLAELMGGVLVVADELPAERATLWLRLLGRREVQRRAIAELLGQVKREPLADATLALVVAWRQSLPPTEQQTPQEQEQMENWQKVYERWEKKVWLEGKAEGEAKGEAAGKAAGEAAGKVAGKAESVVAVLRARGLKVSAAQERQILGCSDEAKLTRWLTAAVTAPSTGALLGPARRRR